jgi:hypothetical protein
VIAVIPPETCRIRTVLVMVTPHLVPYIPDDQAENVTTKEGEALRTGDIAWRGAWKTRGRVDGAAALGR